MKTPPSRRCDLGVPSCRVTPSTCVHLTMPGVVSSSNLRPFGPRCSAQASRKCVQDAKKALKTYQEHVLLPQKSGEDYDASDAAQHAPQVFVSLPPGCVRADCGGAYVRLKRDNGVGHVPRDGSALYQQQGGAHHLYRISKPFVAWMARI
jgi:hypothetical protein